MDYTDTIAHATGALVSAAEDIIETAILCPLDESWEDFTVDDDSDPLHAVLLAVYRALGELEAVSMAAGDAGSMGQAQRRISNARHARRHA